MPTVFVASYKANSWLHLEVIPISTQTLLSKLTIYLSNNPENRACFC